MQDQSQYFIYWYEIVSQWPCSQISVCEPVVVVLQHPSGLKDSNEQVISMHAVASLIYTRSAQFFYFDFLVLCVVCERGDYGSGLINCL